MADGRRREMWIHTSNLIATLINGNPYREGRAVTASEFNPYADEVPVATVTPQKMPLSILRFAFFPNAPTPDVPPPC